MEKPNILFIMTKIDLLSEEEWQLVRQRREQILLTEFGNRLPDTRVWPISNRLLQMLTDFLGRISSYRLDHKEIPLISLHDKEQTKHEDEDLQLTLFAIARTSLDSDMAIVDNTYIVQAGLSQGKPENANSTSLNLAIHDTNEHVRFDILVHANENIKLTTERYKILNYNPRLLEFQFVEFSFQPRAPGHCILDVHFYHEQRWLTSTQIEFEASEKLQLSAPSSEGEFSPAQTQRTRLTYGVDAGLQFDPGIDPISKRYWDKNLGTWFCRDRFLVLVEAGDAINPGQVIDHRLLLPAGQDWMEVSFYETSQKQARYTDEKYVKKIGTITMYRGDIDLGLDLSVEVKIGFDMPRVEDKALAGRKTGDIALAWIEASVVDERSGNRTSRSRFEITS